MPADFAQVRRIFEAACDLDAEARARFVESECGSDAQLRAEVLRMIADNAVISHAGFLAESAFDRASHPAFLDPDDPLALTRGAVVVGGFRIVRRLASGGMGTVYVAEQQAPQRSVALKVLKPAYATGANLRRFQVESEILGRLKHDGIAEIHGAGTHPLGEKSFRLDLPWYAMEYLEDAQPLVAYARAHDLDIRARFELFAAVCDAVQYAHGMGVIHRDLKPANVLVGKNGKPKIIDFGIARAVTAEDQTAEMHTRTGELIGTLRYMAPEQIDGDPAKIDVRTDVYALGVMLYELLTNRVPHDVDGRPITEALRILREQDAQPPSKYEARLAGEPEWIVLKAIEKDPARRYATAAALQDDVQRYLRHEALDAGPPSGLYRTRKFVRRHRAAVIASCAVFVSLVGGLIAATISRNRAVDAERDTKAALDRALDAEKTARQSESRALDAEKTAKESEARAKDAADVSNRVVELFEHTFEQARTEERGLDLKVVDALDRSAETVTNELKDRPDLAARLVSRFARLYTSLGDDVRSRERHEQVVRLEKEAGIDLTPEGLEDRAGLIEMRMRVADYEGAQQMLDETRAQVTAMSAPDQLFLLRLDDAQGRLLDRLGRPKEAEVFLRKAAEARERLLGFDNVDTLSSWNVLNVALQEQGRFAEAEPIAREVLDGYMRVCGPDLTVTQMARANLAALLQDSSIGKHEEARDLLEEALKTYERVTGPDFPDAIVTLTNLAYAHARCGQVDQAAADYAEAVVRARRRFGTTHPLTLQITVAAARFDMRRDVAKSEEMTRTAIEAASRPDAPAGTAPFVAALHTAHAEALRLLGKKDEAQTELAAAIPILRAAYGDEGPETKQALEYLRRLESE